MERANLIETQKRCEQCGIEKDIGLFRKVTNQYTGVHPMSICKDCHKSNQERGTREAQERQEKEAQERIEREQQKRQERERQEQEQQARNREASLAANRVCPRCKVVRTDGRLWPSGHLYFTHYCDACQDYTPHLIYTLTCPLLGMVRYVGITMQSLNKRLQGHVRGDSGTKRKNDWIEALKQHDLKPVIALVSEAPNEQQAKRAEMQYILHYIQQGYPLVNGEAMDSQLVLDTQNSMINFLEASEEEIRDLFRHFSLDELVERGRQQEYQLVRYQKQRWFNRYNSVYIIYNASAKYIFGTKLDTLKREWALRYNQVFTSDELPVDRQERETILQNVTEALFYTEDDRIRSDLIERDCRFLLERKIPIASQYYHTQDYHTEHGLLTSIATTNKKYPCGKAIMHPLSYTVSPEKSLMCAQQQ